MMNGLVEIKKVIENKLFAVVVFYLDSAHHLRRKFFVVIPCVDLKTHHIAMKCYRQIHHAKPGIMRDQTQKVNIAFHYQRIFREKSFSFSERPFNEIHHFVVERDLESR